MVVVAMELSNPAIPKFLLLIRFWWILLEVSILSIRIVLRELPLLLEGILKMYIMEVTRGTCVLWLLQSKFLSTLTTKNF
jgi:hypothetical protein